MTRVAIGPAEVAGTSTALAEGLRAHGVDAELALWSPLPGFFPSDRALGRAARARYALTAPARRDVVHFQYDTTWLPGFADALWARAWGRTVVVTYHGDDCRLARVAHEHGWPMAHLKDPAADDAVERRLRRMARLCHAAIAMDLEVASYLEPYFARVYVAPVPLHNRAADRSPRAGESDRLRVLHAPSDPVVKGTGAVRAAVRGLPLELVELSGVDHGAVVEALEGADLVVDQMYSVSASVFALEAMRAGVPVLTHLDSRGLAPFHADMPITPVTPETLAHELASLAADPERRRRLGEAGRAYVARRHAATQAARAVLRVYEHARRAPPGLYQATAEGVEPL